MEWTRRCKRILADRGEPNRLGDFMRTHHAQFDFRIAKDLLKFHAEHVRNSEIASSQTLNEMLRNRKIAQERAPTEDEVGDCVCRRRANVKDLDAVAETRRKEGVGRGHDEGDAKLAV